MKKKLIGLLIGFFLILTSTNVVVAKELLHEINDIGTEKQLDDDVPIWNLGDGWEYRTNQIDIELGLEDQPIHINAIINNLFFEITDTSGDSYKVEYSSKIEGDLVVNINFDYPGLPNSSLIISGSLILTKLSGLIEYNKSDLGIKEIDTEISGILKIKIEEQPFLPLPAISIPIPFRIILNLKSDNAYKILDFPLENGKVWGLSSAIFSFNGEIRSIWLNLINLINNIFAFFGKDLIPDDIAEILPVIDIMNMINVFGLNELFDRYLEMEGYPDILSVINTELITVEAGTFNAYNISIMNGLGYIYYSPEVGNIIKTSGFKINIELIRVVNG
jgi:hypothetical protein